jgi:hypothetical protein
MFLLKRSNIYITRKSTKRLRTTSQCTLDSSWSRYLCKWELCLCCLKFSTSKYSKVNGLVSSTVLTCYFIWYTIYRIVSIYLLKTRKCTRISNVLSYWVWVIHTGQSYELSTESIWTSGYRTNLIVRHNSS